VLAIAFAVLYRRLRAARRSRGDELVPEPFGYVIEPFRLEVDPDLDALRQRVARLLISFNVVGASAVVLLALHSSG
jgi:hypothetical protein